MSRARAIFVLAWLAGCSCDDAEPAPRTHDPVAPIEVPAPVSQLPTAGRADLPAASPAITITVGERTFVVSNRALVATWPPAERQAVGQTRPLGDADYPSVEREVNDATIALMVPGLHDAMSEVLAVETARSSIVHAGGITPVFALRAGPDVPFGRVLAAIYAAALTGFNEPRLVLASPDGERELRLTRAPMHDEPAAALGAALSGALSGATGIDSGVSAALSAEAVRTSVVSSDAGLAIARGGIAFAPGCVERAPADTATIPAALVTPSAIDACFAALGTPSAIVFRAPSASRYGDVVSVLETLATHGSVSLEVQLE